MTVLYWCPKCGIVWTSADGPPWCRHYALDLSAARMVPIPPGHPYATSLR